MPASEVTCAVKRTLATKMIDLSVPLDGTSAGYINGENKDDFKQFDKIVSNDRPRMYYFKVLDCDRNLFNMECLKGDYIFEIRPQNKQWLA